MVSKVEEMPKRRGRPVQSSEEAEKVKAHIGSCAFRLFREEGYPAVSMRRLAQEAGCTVMTIYRYYPRKIDILRDLWAEVFGDLFDLLVERAGSIASPALRLEALSHGYVEYWLDRREHYFLVFMSSGVSQSDVSVFVEDDAVLKRFGIFRESLAAALPGAGEAELKLKADLLLCTLNGIAHNLITISAYPWAAPRDMVRAATRGVLGIR
jgi:AcrR family transcriptional regulator